MYETTEIAACDPHMLLTCHDANSYPRDQRNKNACGCVPKVRQRIQGKTIVRPVYERQRIPEQSVHAHTHA